MFGGVFDIESNDLVNSIRGIPGFITLVCSITGYDDIASILTLHIICTDTFINMHGWL